MNTIDNTVEQAKDLARHFGAKFFPLREKGIAYEAFDQFPPHAATWYGVMPVALKGDAMVIATSDPADLEAIDAIVHLIRMDVEPVVATSEDLVWALQEYYSLTEEAAQAAVSGESRRGSGDSGLSEFGWGS